MPVHPPRVADFAVLDPSPTQCYRWVMIPQFDADGLLPPGIHWATWDEVVSVFGITPWRRQLLGGLEMAIESLRRAGFRTVYIDGSFVTDKEVPNDFDACWEEAGVAPELLDPVLLRFDGSRAAQKARYLGELFPASIGATADGMSFREFFQTDMETGRAKGIVAVDLGGLE